MYFTRFEARVQNGRLDDFEAIMERRSGYWLTQPGFVSHRLSMSLGEPTKYAAFQAWESREAAMALQRSAGWRETLDATPFEGVATVSRGSDAYERVFMVGEQGSFDYSSVVHFSVPPAQGQAFEENQRALYELRLREAPGQVVTILYRHLGDPGRYLSAVLRPSLEALRSSLRNPANQQFMREHPASAFFNATPVVDTYVKVRMIRK